MDRRTLGLGIAALVVVGAAVGATINNRRHHTSRDDVAAYVRQVDAVQDDLRYPLTKTLGAYRAFANARAIGPTQARQLDAAQKTLGKVRRRVQALQPPVQAKHLHVLLVKLIGDEAAITHELVLFAQFVPQFRAALATVHIASTRLGVALAAITPPKAHAIKGTKTQVRNAQRAFAAAATGAAVAQADAVSAYDDQLQVALRRLRTLDPPPAFVPEYRTQRRTLRATRVAGEKLAAALRSSNRSEVVMLGRAFTTASRASQAISAQRAEIAAVRAYNRRVRGLGHAAAAVQGEVVHLQRVLP